MTSRDELHAIAWTVVTIGLSLTSFAVAIFCLLPEESTIIKTPVVPKTAAALPLKPQGASHRAQAASDWLQAGNHRRPSSSQQVASQQGPSNSQQHGSGQHQSLSAAPRKRVKRQKVSVLTFHDISPGRTQESLVTPRNEFSKMVRQLRTNGYQTFFASQVSDLTEGYYVGLKKGCKPVVYTFDDGYRNNYELLFPLVKKLNIRVTIFLIVGKVVEERTASTKNALTWAEVQEMSDSGLVEFGSHTYDLHCNLVSYIKYAGSREKRIKRWRELYRDLRVAKRVLEEKLGKPVTTLAWPHGKRSSNHMKLAHKAGYTYVFNTQFGTNVPGHTNYCDLRRISSSSRWMSAEALLKRLWYAERGRGLDGKPRRFAWARQ